MDRCRWLDRRRGVARARARAPPVRRLQDGTLQHVWLAIIVAISVLWATNAWLDDGPGHALAWRHPHRHALRLGARAHHDGGVSGIAALVFDATWQGIALTISVLRSHAYRRIGAIAAGLHRVAAA